MKDALVQQIRDTFAVEVRMSDWQHWNGGVYLYDDRGIPFLAAWHTMTQKIFEDPCWSERDQGTLVAAAWKFGLQDQPLLPIEYNFLADYYAPQQRYRGNLEFDIVGKKSNVRPYFMHVYHHFGDGDWELWQDIERLLPQHRLSPITAANE